MIPQRDEPAQLDLVDEVRAIRRQLVAECKNDVDRLCDHLIQVGEEFKAGGGRFAGLLSRCPEDVVASWGDAVHDTTNPLAPGTRP